MARRLSDILDKTVVYFTAQAAVRQGHDATIIHMPVVTLVYLMPCLQLIIMCS